MRVGFFLYSDAGKSESTCVLSARCGGKACQNGGLLGASCTCTCPAVWTGDVCQHAVQNTGRWRPHPGLHVGRTAPVYLAMPASPSPVPRQVLLCSSWKSPALNPHLPHLAKPSSTILGDREFKPTVSNTCCIKLKLHGLISKYSKTKPLFSFVPIYPT